MVSSHQQDAQQVGMVECLGQEMHCFHHRADLESEMSRFILKSEKHHLPANFL
jgi:hypothetical protein